MHSPSQPAPPDPAVQTSAEAAANRYNINSPFGTQTWTNSGPTTIGYDSKGQPITGQDYTQNITLDPSEQRQFDTRNQISELLMNQGQQGIEQGLPGYHGSGAVPALPSSVTNPTPAQPFDINAASSPAADAQFKRTMDYVTPYFARQNAAQEQDLANKGLPIGSAAYKDAHDITADEQNRTVEQAAEGAAALAPQIATQGYQTNLAGNAQNFGQGLAGYQAAMGGEQQQTQQDLARRQEYYNEIASALGGQQLNPINAGGGGGDNALNVANAYQQYNQGVQTNANNANASNNALISALLGMGGSLGAAAIKTSDERSKYDIEEVDTLPSGDKLYEFHYNWEPEDAPKHTGVLAQEQERIDPKAVITGPDGIKRVDYRRVMARALLAA